MMETTSQHVLRDRLLLTPHLCAIRKASEVAVGLPQPDTEGIFCRFLEHSPMKGKIVRTMPLSQAEIWMLMAHSYPISKHTERG